jgi:transporter family protein
MTRPLAEGGIRASKSDDFLKGFPRPERAQVTLVIRRENAASGSGGFSDKERQRISRTVDQPRCQPIIFKWGFCFPDVGASSHSRRRIPMEVWFILAIGVAFLWGSAGVFAKLSTPSLGVARVALLIAAVEGVMYFSAFLFWRENVPISLSDGILAAASCIIGISGYLCFFESIMEGQVAIAGTISAAYPALTVIGAIVVLSESLTAVQSFGVIAIIGGVIALSYEPNPGTKHAMNRRSLVFALMAFVLWGFWSLTSKMAIDEIGAGNIFAFYVLSALTAPVLYGWFRRVHPTGLQGSAPTPKVWVLGAVGLALNVSGAWAYSFALGQGSASLVVPISSAYPLITVVMAVIFLRERLGRLHIPALALVLAGLILLGLTV